MRHRDHHRAGVAAAIQGICRLQWHWRLPYNLAGVQVTFGGAQAPIYNVANSNGQQQVTVQVPCSVDARKRVGGGNRWRWIGQLQRSGSAGEPRPLYLPQFTSTTDSGARASRWFVRYPRATPLIAAKTLIAYVTGLGPRLPPSPPTRSLRPVLHPSVQGTIIVGMNGQGVRFISASPHRAIWSACRRFPLSCRPRPPGGNSTFSVGVLPQGSGNRILQ